MWYSISFWFIHSFTQLLNVNSFYVNSAPSLLTFVTPNLCKKRKEKKYVSSPFPVFLPAGTNWVYSVYLPNYSAGTDRFCHKTTYQFAFIVTSLIWVLLSLVFLCGGCFLLVTWCKFATYGLSSMHSTFYGGTSDFQEHRAGGVWLSECFLSCSCQVWMIMDEISAEYWQWWWLCSCCCRIVLLAVLMS